MVENEAISYRVYPIRWVQLLIFFFANFTNAIHSMTFSAIELQTSIFFGITATQVNVLAIVFLFLYLPGTVLSIWMYRMGSIRRGMIVGSVLNLGAFIRLFALISPSHGYSALLIGQLFPAIGGPLLLNITALFAARWFAPKQRDIATAVGSMANPLGKCSTLRQSSLHCCMIIVGIAVGSFVPSVIVTDGSFSRSFFILLIVEACFTALTTGMVIFFFRSEPLTPPSPSEEKGNHQLTNRIKTDFLTLLTNRNYLIILFAFSLGLALFNAITTLLYQIIEPSGYSSTDAGIFGAIIIIAGLVSAFIAGVVMDRTHAYRLIFKILLVCAAAASIYFVLILQPNKVYPLAVSIGLMGFFLLPLLPVSFECAAECTYPIPLEWSTGLLLCTGNLLGGVFIFIMQALTELPPVSTSGVIITPTSIFILCIVAISTIVALCYNGPYKRLEAEQNAATTVILDSFFEKISIHAAHRFYFSYILTEDAIEHSIGSSYFT